MGKSMVSCKISLKSVNPLIFQFHRKSHMAGSRWSSLNYGNFFDPVRSCSTMVFSFVAKICAWRLGHEVDPQTCSKANHSYIGQYWIHRLQMIQSISESSHLIFTFQSFLHLPLHYKIHFKHVKPNLTPFTPKKTGFFLGPKTSPRFEAPDRSIWRATCSRHSRDVPCSRRSPSGAWA